MTTVASRAIPALLLCVTLAAPRSRGAGADADVALLLEKTGIRGGLGLVLGARDTTPATALAEQSVLYVQLLQPDARLAAQWAAALAASTNREQVGVRDAAFDPSHYGSRLFNLVVVEDAAALGQATPADLQRILVPNGVAAFRKLPPAFAAAAQASGAGSGTAGAYAFCRLPAAPVAWKLPLETKWLAGPRSQIANGYSGVCTGDGKLFYLEQMERNEGDLNNSAAVLFARDACNGRTLWTRELPGTYARNSYVGLAATSKGRLFAKSAGGPLTCLDGTTGRPLFEVAPNVHRENTIWLLNDDLLSVHGDVRSTETGKPLWKYPTQRYQPLPGTIIGTNIFFCDGTAIFAKRVATGEDVWRIAATNLPKPVHAGSLARADDSLLVRMGGAPDELNIALLDSATGKLLWTYLWKIRVNGEKYFNASSVRHTTADGKLLLYYRHNQPGIYPDEMVATRLDLTTGKPEVEDRINKDAGDFHGCFGELHLGDYIAYYDIWYNQKTLETAKAGMPHPACFFGSSTAYGLVFNFPSRKSGPISAVGPADAIPEGPGAAGALRKVTAAPAVRETGPDDWPMFRAAPAGGNAAPARPGKDLAKRWETRIGLGHTGFGVMSSQRTGLSQAVLGYGLAIVADIDGQRIVAVDAADGKPKWIYAVGSRVDFPPTLYKGLCLVAGRDGCVHALDAATGQLVYKLMAAPRERYIGGREKLESRWPLASDVLVAGGVAYVSGGAGSLAFKPETGEVVESKNPGRELHFSYDIVLKGNSIPRTNEDNWEGFRRAKLGDRLDARVLTFDDTLTVAYQFRPAGEGWANKGALTLKGITDNPAKPAWTSPPIELVVDDIVLTPAHIYCVGHYQRVKKDPELWVLSREDGKVLNTVPVDGFPAFLGMSVAGNRLFVATREGKLVCFEGK
jgi:outer membrane protein assembly factor BamB